MITLADRLFASYREFNAADWAVYERLCEIFGDKAIADNSHDEYDRSLEIYADDNALVPTREQANAVLAMGFAKFWINYRDETEIIVTTSHIGACRKRSYPKWNDKERKRTLHILPPTPEEVSSYRDLFRSELDKNMNNSSGSPSTDAHTVALHAFVAGRNA